MNQLNFHNENTFPVKPPPPPTLPIIEKLKAAYKLWLDYLQHFPKIHRFTFGSKINALFLELLELIFIASYLPKELKNSQLAKAASKLDLLKFFCQITWENKLLDNKKYAVLSIELAQIGRMLGGWIKQLGKK
ncbi:MAG: diversity-generating retroelement protein Avd [bacterium]|nr:diversity-generating retroelement protein Avd [bacterium]